jgi:hypothetical protein
MLLMLSIIINSNIGMIGYHMKRRHYIRTDDTVLQINTQMKKQIIMK